MSDKAAGPTLLQRVVMWILHAVMFYVVALYPVYLMARFQPDDIVHYGFLRWMAVVLILYWVALQLFFTERPSETRVGRMLAAVTAGIVLITGAFSPIVSFSFIGDVDYFRGGYGDGYILLIMAGLSLALAVTGRWKQVLVPALGSLAVILWTFLGVQDTITQARAGLATELTGNPHEGLAASVMQSIQWEWGWILLFAGSGLLVYSAARRDQPEAESPPLVSVAAEDEPETVAAETASATEMAAELDSVEEATVAAAETVDAPELVEPTAEAPAEETEAAAEAPAEEAEAAAAPAEKAEAAPEAPTEEAEAAPEAPAEQAEAATAAPEAPEPATEEAEAAPAESAGDDEEPKAAESGTAAEAGASAQEAEGKPAEAAEEPTPKPEAASETAPATSKDETEIAAEKSASAPAEAATEESASPAAEAEKASVDESDSAAAEPATGGSTETATSASEPTPDAAKE